MQITNIAQLLHFQASSCLSWFGSHSHQHYNRNNDYILIRAGSVGEISDIFMTLGSGNWTVAVSVCNL